MIISNSKNDYRIIFKSKCIRELQNAMEDIAVDFKNKFEIGPMVFYKKSKSKKHGWHPYGYFLVAQRNKITIFHKYINKGILYNSEVIEKINSFFLIEPKKNTFIPAEKFNYLNAASLKINLFKDIHKELIGKTSQTLLRSEDSQSNI